MASNNTCPKTYGAPCIMKICKNWFENIFNALYYENLQKVGLKTFY